MEDLTVFAARLKSARIMKQLSMDELCDAMRHKVSKPTISKYEHGKMMPQPEVLQALCEALDVDEAYFRRPLTCSAMDCHIEFRKRSSMSTTAVKALKVKSLDKAERYLEIDQILLNANASVAHRPLPHRTGIKTREEAEKFAQEVRQAWGLGDFPIVNVQQLLEQHGIKVIPVADTTEFDALCGKINDDQYFVVINEEQIHTERRRFSSMHEVGHLLMDFDESLDSRTIENLCHAFASEMLLPAAKFRTMATSIDKNCIVTLRPIQAYYGISIDALMHKAADVGIITQSQYTSFNIYKRQSKAFRNAVEASIYREMPLYDSFGSQVLQAYALGLIDQDKAKSLTYDATDQLKNDLQTI